jgi:multiple sugar transport system ATP-binding protein
MARVTFDQVSKVFRGGVQAVTDLSLGVDDGEFLVLVGPSGCGKSTVLRLVAGLEDVTAGRVFIDDDMVNNLAPRERDVAMVFQNYALYPHMTVERNLSFSLRIGRRPQEEIHTQVADTAHVLGLEQLLDRRPSALSGGQRQRVAMGRAMVRHPRVFLMDEPLSNLDAKLRVAMRGELSRLHQRLHTTTLYVTHDQIEAMTLGDRIAVLDHGRLQQVGTPQDLYDTPANVFVAGFIGSPAMNLAQGRIIAGPDGLDLVAGDHRWPLPAAAVERRPALRDHVDQPVVFGVRPHDLTQVTAATPADTPRLRFRTVTVESLGSERNVLFVPPLPTSGLSVADAEGGDLWTARLPGTAPFRAGTDAELALDLTQAHFFDAATSAAIPVTRPVPAMAG